MKLSTSILQQIIKEELQVVLEQDFGAGSSTSRRKPINPEPLRWDAEKGKPQEISKYWRSLPASIQTKVPKNIANDAELGKLGFTRSGKHKLKAPDYSKMKKRRPSRRQGRVAKTIEQAAFGQGVLRQGHRGPAVKRLQQELIHGGYLPAFNRDGSDAADGKFGRGTKEGVREYQRRNPGLGVDGVVGTNTAASIMGPDWILRNSSKLGRSANRIMPGGRKAQERGTVPGTGVEDVTFDDDEGSTVVARKP